MQKVEKLKKIGSWSGITYLKDSKVVNGLDRPVDLGWALSQHNTAYKPFTAVNRLNWEQIFD